MESIFTENAPKAIGPYSQAIRLNGLIYLSGQIPINPAVGEIVPGGIKEQTEQVFSNIQAVLTEGGSSLKNIVKTTVFLADMKDFQGMNEVYGSYLNEPYPARSCVQVARLPRDVLVEIEVIAVC